jgi:hypothetical protein
LSGYELGIKNPVSRADTRDATQAQSLRDQKQVRKKRKRQNIFKIGQNKFEG